MSGTGTGAGASILGSIRREFVNAIFSDWLVLGDVVSELLSEDL